MNKESLRLLKLQVKLLQRIEKQARETCVLGTPKALEKLDIMIKLLKAGLTSKGVDWNKRRQKIL